MPSGAWSARCRAAAAKRPCLCTLVRSSITKTPIATCSNRRCEGGDTCIFSVNDPGGQAHRPRREIDRAATRECYVTKVTYFRIHSHHPRASFTPNPSFTHTIHSKPIIHDNKRIRECFLNTIRSHILVGNVDYSIFANRVLKKYLVEDRPPRTHVLSGKQQHGVS